MKNDSPTSACLYRHFDGDGALLYIGVSLNVVMRLAQHRDHSAWFEAIAKVTVERFPTRAKAIAAEREAIRQERPKHNIHHSAEAKRKSVVSSRAFLMEQMVTFKPIYRIEELKEVLPLRKGQILAYQDAGVLGYIELPSASTTTPATMRRYVTGWQLIEFIEFLESERKPRQR